MRRALIRSASSLSSRITSASPLISVPGILAATSDKMRSRRAAEKSWPPRRLSPAAAMTSNMPLFRLRSDTSSVPPPRSYTITVSACAWLCRPYAIAAAVGS